MAMPLAATPNNLAQRQLHATLGEAFAARGNLAEAAVHYEAALNLEPWSTDRLCDLATIFFKMMRFDEAATLYRAALYVDPRHYLPKDFSERSLRHRDVLIECPYCPELVVCVRLVPDGGSRARKRTQSERGATP